MDSIIKIISDLFALVIMFGLEGIAIVILIISALFSRRLVVVILLGIVASALMFVQSFVWWVVSETGFPGDPCGGEFSGSAQKRSSEFLPGFLFLVYSFISRRLS